MKISMNEPQLQHLMYSYKKNQEVIQERGLDTFEHRLLFKEFYLGSYGRADLVGVNIMQNDNKHRTIDIYVYELKQKHITVNTLIQCSKYVSAFKRFIQKSDIPDNILVEINTVLVGKTFDFNSDFCYLAGILPNSSYYLYDFSATGLNFKNVNPETYIPVDNKGTGMGRLDKISLKDTYKEIVADSMSKDHWIQAKYYPWHFHGKKFIAKADIYIPR